MNPEISSANSGANPFWICLLVFTALAVDAGFRLAKALEQKENLEKARTTQNASVTRAADALAKTDKVEEKLQAVSVDLLELGRTNVTAAQLIREFNISWTPGTQTAAPASLPPTNPAVRSSP